MGSTKPKAGGIEMIKQEETVVAVLIADSFSVRFAPITESKPKARKVLHILNMHKICLVLQQNV